MARYSKPYWKWRKFLSLLNLSDLHQNLFKVEGFRRRCPFTPLFCLSCEQSLFVFRTQEHFQAGTEPKLSLLSIYLEQKGWMSRECTSTQSGLQKPSNCFMRLLFHPCTIPVQPNEKKRLVTSMCEHSHMAGGTAWLHFGCRAIKGTSFCHTTACASSPQVWQHILDLKSFG